MSGSGLGSHGFTGSWCVALPVPVQEDESPSLQVLSASSLALQMSDLDTDQGSEIAFNSFGTRSRRGILGYRWSDFVSNERLLRETQIRFVTCIVLEHQLRLYGHVARFPEADPAHQILSARESRESRRPMGRPRASWLKQVDQHLKERGMGQTSAWGMARRRPVEYRRKVDAATRCSCACSHT